ncbi:cadherin-7 [Austrofundulus limnaeus]|uniref:Cadherin-7 n=1 Tax=Austrofundulus limnaeus TaxID=52670 RepID=A0A2I4D8Z8_AUSLI|nr:PREDICTED: cadherin-7-like [Austrofundulus limnaeus]
MKRLCFLSVLSVFVSSVWKGSGCGAMDLVSDVLHHKSSEESRQGHVLSHLRRRRSWVWNQFFVLEENTGVGPLHIGKLHSEKDKGDGQVRYSLSGDGAASIFTIEEDTGDIHATKRLDREQQAYYTLRVQARDRNTNLLVEPESQFIIKVQDINDNAPRFLDGPYTTKVAEGSPVGTSVVTVVATDADDPTYGNSARLVYSILQGQPYFSVDPKTGVVRTALPNLDREVQDQYLLVIQAKDMLGQMGALSGSTTVTVTLTDVNDNPPHFPRKSYQFIVPESVLVSSVVARIRAVDLDVGPNAEVDYKILDGDGLGTFRIQTDPNTQEGLVSLHKTLDFETKSSYTLNIEASNQHVDPRYLLVGSFTDVTTVLLLVGDVDEPPAFSVSVSQMMVSEAALVGSHVGSVSAHDPDSSNSPIRYSIDRTSDVEHFFMIDSSSGVISTNRRLDREMCDVYNLTVLATETLDLSQVGKAVVLISVMDVNDNAPSFAIKYQTSVCENAPPGQVIETLSAVDPDEPETGHHFQFFLAANAAMNQSFSFSLRDNNDNTASLLVQRAGVLQQDLLLLPVVISDGGSPSLSSTNTLTVSVCTCEPQGAPRVCRQGVYLLTPGLSVLSAAALTCVLTLSGVVMVTVVLRLRRTECQTVDNEPVLQENMVCYDDEGGGEEDTRAFDMFTLTHLNLRGGSNHTHLNLRGGSNQSRTQKTSLFQEFLRDQLQEADLDPTAPPLDFLQTYAFEGHGSVAESLSSLDSLTSLDPLTLLESEHSYAFLRDWGPRFRRLADLYGHTQKVGVASDHS